MDIHPFTHFYVSLFMMRNFCDACAVVSILFRLTGIPRLIRLYDLVWHGSRVGVTEICVNPAEITAALFNKRILCSNISRLRWARPVCSLHINRPWIFIEHLTELTSPLIVMTKIALKNLDLLKDLHGWCFMILVSLRKYWHLISKTIKNSPVSFVWELWNQRDHRQNS